ncbi:MAG TPA: hypothetical protein QF683_16750 [SAR324 cluster bacterium]|nr:hypothetical protein [SAR324 cluster bacterium]
MRLERMGSSFPTRLSFMRTLIRRMAKENWCFERLRFDVDQQGYGISVYAAITPERTYSLVAFTDALDPERRTDRVIAEAWDATFNLFDGIPNEQDLERLRNNTPKQEAGRYLPSELVLSRANKSLRLFDHIVQRLASGHQPEISLLNSVGYLMRTTAVYGSGKFGSADRNKISQRPESKGAFQVEMLNVFLVRWFSIDLVEHVARCLGGQKSVQLDPELKRSLGIGNATGLGMAPFLVNHPQLVHNWVAARETALARIRSLKNISKESLEGFNVLMKKVQTHIGQWRVDDEEQTRKIEQLEHELKQLDQEFFRLRSLESDYLWEKIYQYSHSNFSLEGQELVVSLMIEPHGVLVDELAETMHSSEKMKLEPSMPLGKLKELIEVQYNWALEIDFEQSRNQQHFWYYSEDKLEPRFGDRYRENGAELEMPLAVARDVSELYQALKKNPLEQSTAEFTLSHPQFRRIIRRIQSLKDQSYAEIRDNLVGDNVRPIDLLRFKLAFFGATKFDPKSDLWTRITMFQGAPMPDELSTCDPDAWAFTVKPELNERKITTDAFAE